MSAVQIRVNNTLSHCETVSSVCNYNSFSLSRSLPVYVQYPDSNLCSMVQCFRVIFDCYLSFILNRRHTYDNISKIPQACEPVKFISCVNANLYAIEYWIHVLCSILCISFELTNEKKEKYAKSTVIFP